MPSRNNFRTGALLAVALTVFVLFVTGALSTVTAVFSRAISYVAAPVASIVKEGSPSAGLEAPQLIAELDRVRAENARLRQAEAENEELRQLLGFHERTPDESIPAHALARTTDDVFKGLVIDRGERDGMRAGQPVVAGDGVIVGKIFETRNATSSAMLLTDTRSRLAVTVNGEDGTAGVLEGERGLSMRVTLIPATSRIAPGDTIVTSGLEAGIRRGLLVGTVDKVIKNTQDPFQTALVTPFEASANPSSLLVLVSGPVESEEEGS